jgi:hypothetical protein
MAPCEHIVSNITLVWVPELPLDGCRAALEDCQEASRRLGNPELLAFTHPKSGDTVVLNIEELQVYLTQVRPALDSMLYFTSTVLEYCFPLQSTVLKYWPALDLTLLGARVLHKYCA